MFYRWKHDLPPFVELCPILLPGREARLSEPLCINSMHLMEQIIRSLTMRIDRPYAIFGHSMGALLAFELARSLRSHGLREPDYLFLSGRNAPQHRHEQQSIHHLPTDLLLAELHRRYGGLPHEILSDPQMLEIFLPILRADLTLLETHRYREQLPLDCPVMAFAGVHDRNVSNEGLAAWSQLTTASFEAQRFGGDHFYLSGEGRAPLLERISETLAVVHRAALDELQSSVSEEDGRSRPTPPLPLGLR